MQRPSRFRLAAVSGLLAIGLTSAGYFAGTTDVLTADTKKPAISAADPKVSHANTLSEAFRSSAAHVLPAVVSIRNEMKPQVVRRELRAPRGERFEGQLPPGFENLDPFLRRFFEDMPDMDQFDQMPSPRQQGSGSGVIIDPSGVILTNNHVVAGGGKVTVKLHDGREFVATEVKTDPNTDIAVVKIKTSDSLPAAKLGNSDELQIGDWVLALGQPFGLEKTVTAGIISAKGRDIGIMNHEEFLQTDAAINPGNSGGPLINLQGEVVGVNTAISSMNGGFQGVGFAVPVNVAKWVSGQLLDGGSVRRAYLGVGIQPVDVTLAEQLGLGTPGGALVTEVQPDSPAAQAGVKRQDVIVEFGGSHVNSHRQLSAVVGRSPIGSKQPLVVVRDGKRVTLEVTVRQQPENYGVRTTHEESSEPSAPQGKDFDKLGLEVAPLTEDVANQIGLKTVEGVVIVAVEENSPAELAGLRPQMAIVQVGRQNVKSVDDFTAAVAKADLAKGMLMLVRTEEGSRYLVVKE